MIQDLDSGRSKGRPVSCSRILPSLAGEPPSSFLKAKCLMSVKLTG